jgi:hypothetical protein
MQLLRDNLVSWLRNKMFLTHWEIFYLLTVQFQTLWTSSEADPAGETAAETKEPAAEAPAAAATAEEAKAE